MLQSEAKCQPHRVWQEPFVIRVTAKDRGWLQGATEAMALASRVCKNTGQTLDREREKQRHERAGQTNQKQAGQITVKEVDEREEALG